MRRRLIITGDDYGMCEAVNAAVEECLAAGALRATCVMANMPACGTAIGLRRTFPRSSIGIHWNLSQGRPLLPPAQIPSLVGSEGEFHPAPALRRRLLRGEIPLAEIAAELQAQFRRFCELAGMPDFWNTHENVHVIPRLFHACVALGRGLGIRAMRCHRRVTLPRDDTPAHYHLGHPLYWLKGQIIARWSRRAEAQGVLMPDGRIYVPGYAEGAAAIETVLGRVPWQGVDRALELIAHPATTVDAALFGGMTESRVLEYQGLRDPGLLERLQGAGVEVVGFEALRAS
jgi:predicted glycoside hydrolase/deacetylase ChbG (UPF0249 family)